MKKLSELLSVKSPILGIFLGLALWLLIGFYLGYTVVGFIVGLSVVLFFVFGQSEN
jgi:hypothetical protein